MDTSCTHHTHYAHTHTTHTHTCTYTHTHTHVHTHTHTHTHYTIMNSIHINKLKFGSTSITSAPEIGLLLDVENCSLGLSADFDIDYGGSSKSTNKLRRFFGGVAKNIFDAARRLLGGEGKNSLEVSTDSVSVRLGLLVSANEEGHPQINATQCSFEMNDFNLTFSGELR